MKSDKFLFLIITILIALSFNMNAKAASLIKLEAKVSVFSEFSNLNEDDIKAEGWKLDEDDYWYIKLNDLSLDKLPLEKCISDAVCLNVSKDNKNNVSISIDYSDSDNGAGSKYKLTPGSHIEFESYGHDNSMWSYESTIKATYLK